LVNMGGEATVRSLGEEVVKGLLDVVVRIRGHAAIVGAVGEGKEEALREVLQHVPSNYTVIALDDSGRLEGYTDYYAPYPINPVDVAPKSLVDVIDEAMRASRHRRLSSGARLAIRVALWLVTGEEVPAIKIDLGKYPRSLGGIADLISDVVEMGFITGKRDVEGAHEAVYTLHLLNHWMLDKTHPIIAKALEGGLGGRSIGIDLGVMSEEEQRLLYTLSLMAAVEEFELRNVVLVINEALILEEVPPRLAAWLGTGTSYNRHLVLSPFHMGEVLWGAFHVVLKFPYMFRSAEDALLWRFDPDAERLGPGEARLMVRASSEEAAQWLGTEYAELIVKVGEPKPKLDAITLTRCVEEVAGESAKEVIDDIRRNGFEKTKHQGEAKLVWECIGR